MESRSAWAVVSEVDSDEDGGLVRLTGDKDQLALGQLQRESKTWRFRQENAKGLGHRKKKMSKTRSPQREIFSLSRRVTAV